MHRISPTFLRGIGAISTVVVLYATNIVITRYSVLHGLTSFDLAALRYAVAGAVLLPYVWRAGLGDLAGIGWRRGIILTSLAGAPYMVVFLSGLRFAPAAHGAVLNAGIVPSVVFLGLVFLGRQPFSLIRAFSLASIVFGLVLVTGSSFSMHGAVVFGDLLLFLTGISWGLFTLFAKTWDLAPLRATAVVSVLSLLYLPAYAIGYYQGFESVSIAHVLSQAIFQGLVLSIGTVYLVTYAVRALGPQLTALFSPTVPLLTTLLAIPLLGEIPTPVQWVGIGLVVVGMLSAAR
jgi:drug/metabolite transporter (DMT)-like permease